MKYMYKVLLQLCFYNGNIERCQHKSRHKQLFRMLFENKDVLLGRCQSALLGRCQICKGYSFTSKTDQSRHMSIFPPKLHKTQAATSRRQTPLVHKCTYYVVEAGECGAELSSLRLSKLRKHKKNTNHQKLRRKSGQEGEQTKKARGSAPLFQQYLQEHGLQHEDHSDEEELEKNKCRTGRG